MVGGAGRRGQAGVMTSTSTNQLRRAICSPSKTQHTISKSRLYPTTLMGLRILGTAFRLFGGIWMLGAVAQLEALPAVVDFTSEGLWDCWGIGEDINFLTGRDA